MNATRRQQINRLAETVLSTCELATPVDPVEAVRRLRGEIVRVPHADFEAKIEKTDAGFQITLPQDGYETRDRFSIAHELGHLFLHMGYLVDDERWSAIEDYTDSVYYRYGHSTEESEANEFAGAFLMPRTEFLRIAQQNSSGGVYNVTAIAEHFNVSGNAAATRGRFLGIFSWE